MFCVYDHVLHLLLPPIRSAAATGSATVPAYSTAELVFVSKGCNASGGGVQMHRDNLQMLVQMKSQ
jgi:hypothetical protein